MPERRDDPVPRGEDISGCHCAVDIDHLSGLLDDQLLELLVRDARDDDRVPARKDGDSVEQGTRGGVLDQVREDEDERSLPLAHGRERKPVVAVDRARLEVEHGGQHRLGATAAGRQGPDDGAVERDRAHAIAELVRCLGDGDRGIECDVEPRLVAERRSRQPAAVDEAHDVAVSLDPVLIRHRSAHPLGRPPVDLTDVVVVLVVAHRLELRSEAERPATAAFRAQLAALGGTSETPGLRHIGIDDHLGVLT